MDTKVVWCFVRKVSEVIATEWTLCPEKVHEDVTLAVASGYCFGCHRNTTHIWKYANAFSGDCGFYNNGSTCMTLLALQASHFPAGVPLATLLHSVSVQRMRGEGIINYQLLWSHREQWHNVNWWNWLSCHTHTYTHAQKDMQKHTHTIWHVKEDRPVTPQLISDWPH